MGRVRFGDVWISGGDGCGDISPGYAVVREGEVVRAENDDGTAERAVDGADVGRRIDGGSTPALVAGGAGGLPQLIGRARQFHVLQARLSRQPSFDVCR